MGKITFRADDDLVDELEALDSSKSEVMREALREYLAASASDDRDDRDERLRTERPADPQTQTTPGPPTRRPSIDDLVRECVDDVLEQRLAERRNDTTDVNVTIALEGVEGDVRKTPADGTTRRTASRSDQRPVESATSDDSRQCDQCGDPLDDDHVYCPNCGEKASRRLFCECGDEIRSDWSFCPGCGRRTPAADVLESG